MSLYNAVIPLLKQTLSAAPGLLDNATAFCEAKKVDPDVLLKARLYPDMHPFQWQVGSILLHSEGALKAVETGGIAPLTERRTLTSFADMKTAFAETIAKVQAVKAETLDAAASKEVVLDFGAGKMPFVASAYLTSFTLPNFYFHTTIAYAILRHNGVDVGKRDFLGQPQS
jgi:hypothetical protein